MKIFNRLLISLITCFLFIVAVGAEEPTTEDIQEPLVYNIEETTEGTSEVAETVIDKNVNELSQTTENVETTVDENASTENKIPPAEENPTVESLPELATFEKEIIYNEDHTIATVAITYEGECDELTIVNQEGIQELVNIGVYQVDMERSDWVNTIVFNILLNGAFYFDVNVWSAEDLIGTGTIVGYITGLNNDALLFEPNQEPVEYEITSSDVGSTDSRNMTLSYETNVSFTWSIPTELPMADIEDDLTVTVNNSNLATETALRIRVASNNNYNLVNSESGESLSYIITDQSSNVIKNDDVILDHLYYQASSTNTLHFDLTKMPVLSGKYEDTLCFTASVERMLKDIYSGQIVTISNLGTTHNLINTKIYGISKQDGTPTPDSPVEIQSVVNPTVTVSGKNLLNPTLETTTQDGVTCTNNGDGTYTLNGNAEATSYFKLANIIIKGTYKLTGTPSNKGNSHLYEGAKYRPDEGNGVILTEDGNRTLEIYIRVNEGTYNDVVYKPMITTDLSATYDDFEPYKGEQTATLPCTLNAIPVSGGGNITINGQQYISDYVDIENKKLVRNVYEHTFTGDESLANTWFPTVVFSLNYLAIYKDVINNYSDKTHLSPSNNTVSGIGFNNVDSYWGFSSVNELKAWLKSIYDNGKPLKMIYALKEPIVTDLTDAEIQEIQAFKDLYTYTPTTVVSCSSDQLTPYIEFGLS